MVQDGARRSLPWACVRPGPSGERGQAGRRRELANERKTAGRNGTVPAGRGCYEHPGPSPCTSGGRCPPACLPAAFPSRARSLFRGETDRRFFSIEEGRLRYFKAWAALQRLCRWGVWLRAGPSITGSKSAVMRFVTPKQIAILERYFQGQTGVALRLFPSLRS
jgi:hypothetical protein